MIRLALALLLALGCRTATPPDPVLVTTDFAQAERVALGLLPEGKAAIVIQAPMAYFWGRTFSTDGRLFWITIDTSATPEHQVEILIHEVAHVLSWHAGSHAESSHGPMWGVAYAEVYRAVKGGLR